MGEPALQLEAEAFAFTRRAWLLAVRLAGVPQTARHVARYLASLPSWPQAFPTLRAIANELGARSVDTPRRALRALERAGLLGRGASYGERRGEQRSNDYWARLPDSPLQGGPPSTSATPSTKTRPHEGQQQSAHAREKPAAACSSKETPEKPARTRPVRTRRPAPASAGAEAGEGQGAAPPEPSRAGEALDRETGDGAEGDACSVPVLSPSFAHLDAARCAELDELGFGPVEDLLTAGERKLVLQRLGPQELFEIAKALASARARALPAEMRLRLRQRLVLSPRRENFGGWAETLLRLAEAGELAAGRYEDNALMARLWKLENRAVGKGDFDGAARMRRISFEVGQKVSAAIDKLEEEQADAELRALYADELAQKKQPALCKPLARALPAPGRSPEEIGDLIANMRTGRFTFGAA